MSNNPNYSVDTLVEALFKYRGTNCSQVASALGMSRQALFRMIKGKTLKMTTFLEILNLLDLDLNFFDGDEQIVLKSVSGPRIRKKIKGVIYDTDKMFSVATMIEGDQTLAELCYDPVREKYLVARYGETQSLELSDGTEKPD